MNLNDLYSYTDRLIAYVVEDKHREAAEQADKMIKYLRHLYKYQDKLAKELSK